MKKPHKWLQRSLAHKLSVSSSGSARIRLGADVVPDFTLRLAIVVKYFGLLSVCDGVALVAHCMDRVSDVRRLATNETSAFIHTRD